MIETNYSNDVIVNNAIHDEWSSSASENHLSLEQAIEVIKRHKSHNLKTVIGLHLSNQNSDEKSLVREYLKRQDLELYLQIAVSL